MKYHLLIFIESENGVQKLKLNFLFPKVIRIWNAKSNKISLNYNLM